MTAAAPDKIAPPPMNKAGKLAVVNPDCCVEGGIGRLPKLAGIIF